VLGFSAERYSWISGLKGGNSCAAVANCRNRKMHLVLFRRQGRGVSNGTMQERYRQLRTTCRINPQFKTNSCRHSQAISAGQTLDHFQLSSRAAAPKTGKAVNWRNDPFAGSPLARRDGH
jgi:hypothetical protein